MTILQRQYLFNINQKEKQQQEQDRWSAKNDPCVGFEALRSICARLLSVLFKHLKEDFEFSCLCWKYPTRKREHVKQGSHFPNTFGFALYISSIEIFAMFTVYNKAILSKYTWTHQSSFWYLFHITCILQTLRTLWRNSWNGNLWSH